MGDENGILLCIVSDVFLLEWRGCVVVPGAPFPSRTVPVLRRGSPIVLRRPDGVEIQSRLAELEMISRHARVPFTPIRLPAEITKEDVPIGTEIWYFPTPEDTYMS